uniref:DUF432 domain-containing protein n=2 Tax=Bursaphelenchus xylophilus TaxID=6326 RepID=A0A1I7RLN0_BURXY
MATEIYETTIRGHAGVVEDPIVVDLEDEIKGIGDVVHVNLLPLKVQPGKVLLYGKQDRRLKRERHEPLNGTGIIKVLNGPTLKPPAEKPKPWYKKDRFTYNKPTESGDIGLRTRMLAYYNELREPLLAKPEQRALFCNGFAQTKEIIALVVCYKEDTQEAKVYNPELLHEVYLVDVHVPIELAIWVKCLVPLHGAALRAKFVARVDQTQVPFLATPVNFHKQCAVVVQLYVPMNFDQKTNCLVETSFVPRAIARDIDNSRRGQTFFGTIIRVKSCQRGMYPHVAWGVPREIDPENE